MSLVSSFGITEKILFYGFLLIATISIFSYAYLLNNRFLTEIPRSGGSFREGFVGTPRFINPLLATTDTDRDLSSLVFSGLMRTSTKKDTPMIPDIASSYSVSEDGTVYTFILKENVKFHDGTQVTSADIAFTITHAQDPNVKSPVRARWEGVTVEVVNDKEIKFILKQPYSGFLSNTNLGILPKHIWQSVSPEEFPFSNFNLHPIGSGPYKVSKTRLSGSGLVEEITLKAFKNFTLGSPYIKTIYTYFFPNEQSRLNSLIDEEIDAAASISKESAENLEKYDIRLVESPLHRIFGIFFNQNQAPVLLHREIRLALSQAVHKEALVDEILGGYGTAINSPIPAFSKLFSSISASSTVDTIDINAILKNLAEFGWKKNEDGILSKGSEKLIFSIYTSDNPDLRTTATRVSEMWNQIGAIVDIKVFEPAQFNLNVIRPRKYDALLFGITVGRDFDYYAFWHSSQRNDPGLNIALYTNPKADKLLASARTLTNQEERLLSVQAFALEVVSDIPAVFLYSPHFIYALPSYIEGYESQSLRAPGDRFYDIYTWYIETDNVWNIFAKKD